MVGGGGGGGMQVRKNQYIEEWASFRENCEQVFRFSRRNIVNATIFGLAVPLALCMATAYESEHKVAEGCGPERLGQERRYILGSRHSGGESARALGGAAGEAAAAASSSSSSSSK